MPRTAKKGGDRASKSRNNLQAPFTGGFFVANWRHCYYTRANFTIDTIHTHLRQGERIAWSGNLADALGLPVSLLDRQKEQVLKAVADLRGRGQRAHLTEQARPQVAQVDPVHETLTTLFLGQQAWRDTCWKCNQEINPFLEHCPHCGAGVLPF